MIYFAYGSNMEPEQMQSRCPNYRVIGIGLLNHYALAFTRWSRSWNSGTVDIVPEKGGKVYGALYDLNPDDLKRMDKFADYPQSYVRQDVMMECGKEILPALTYVAVRQGVFLPSKSYLRKMIQGAEARKLPEKYTSFLKSIQTHD